ncbi:MAG: NAD-dependent epimerase/dehydratase family protein, partial [Planctomycetota bacterium]
ADVNDATDISPIMTSTRFDAVFHYAALVGVQRTLANPVAVLQDVDGIRNVLSLSKNTGVGRVFYASSSEVYGEPFELPQHEQTTPLNSRLPYAIIKNLGESYCRSYEQEFGLPFNVFRFFNTYGPKQTTDFVVPKFLELARAGKEIPIYGDGMQTRTFCFIDDNLDTTLAVLDDPGLINQTLNIGSDVEWTVLELAQRVIEMTESESRIVHLDPLEEGDMTRRCPDVTRMKGILGRELTSLDDGLRQMIGG